MWYMQAAVTKAETLAAEEKQRFLRMAELFNVLDQFVEGVQVIMPCSCILHILRIQHLPHVVFIAIALV